MTAALLWLSVSTAQATDPWHLQAPGVTVLWPVDVGIALVGVGTYFAVDPIKPWSLPDAVSQPGWPDAPPPHWNPGAELPSDWIGHPLKYHSEFGYTNLAVLTTLGMGVTGGIWGKDVRAGLADSVLVVQTVAVQGAATASLKVAFSRPRPYTSPQFAKQFPGAWADPELQANFTAEEDFDSHKSLPSGHTAAAAGTTFSAATLLWMHQGDPGGTLFWVANGTALAVTGTAGALRMHYGVHHTTDVVAGGLIGAGIGIGLPLLHRSTTQSRWSVGPGPGAGLSVRRRL